MLVSTAAPTNNVKSHYRHAGECIRHMNFIRRVSLEHLILGDQTFGAFGEEHLVAQLNGCAHLAALDQVGMRLENGVDLLGVGNLLSLEHAAAGLIDDLPSQAAVALEFFSKLVKRQVGKQVFAARGSRMREGRSRPVDDLLGYADEFTILAGLLLVPLRRGHPLDRQHAPSRRARAIAKPLIWVIDVKGSFHDDVLLSLIGSESSPFIYAGPSRITSHPVGRNSRVRTMIPRARGLGLGRAGPIF